MKRRKFQMATHAELIFVLPRRVSHFVGSRYAANLKNLTTSSTNPWVTATKIGLCRYYKKSRLELKIPRGAPPHIFREGEGGAPGGFLTRAKKSDADIIPPSGSVCWMFAPRTIREVRFYRITTYLLSRSPSPHPPSPQCNPSNHRSWVTLLGRRWCDICFKQSAEMKCQNK